MTETIHATAVVTGTAGILIRGPSGSGKSLLARDLLEAAAARGTFAALVSDDRTVLTAVAGRLVARPPAVIAGLIEVRNLGLVPQARIDGAVIRLVVDFLPHGKIDRLPEMHELTTEISGIAVSRIALETGVRVPLDTIYRVLRESGPGARRPQARGTAEIDLHSRMFRPR